MSISQPKLNGAPRGLTILGATGSIGTQTLDIVRLYPDAFRIKALTAGQNDELLAKQAREFRPDYAVIAEESKHADLSERLDGTDIEVLAGQEALSDVAALSDVDVVMAAITGFAGLAPVASALKADKEVALANKEALVVAGSLIKELEREGDGVIVPVDSEHSAIFQCLVGESLTSVEELVLTASGGPFYDRPIETFSEITLTEALDHPNWDMGSKITVDSATMMNKGLEVIEAHWLFDVDVEDIRVLVHPQSIVHSMVVFQDGAIKAQMGVPDMKVPIQYALTYPERWQAPHERLDWHAIGSLEFHTPDLEKFPCLRLATQALSMRASAPVVLNAANEQAVSLFLAERISYVDIPRIVESALSRMPNRQISSLRDIAELDAETRQFVLELEGSPSDSSHT